MGEGRGGGGWGMRINIVTYADEVQRLSVPYYHIINNSTQEEI